MRHRLDTPRLLWTAFLLLSSLGALSCAGHPEAKAAETWYCPMHPTYTSDRPGTCPICNMDLVLREPAAGAAPEAEPAASHAALDLTREGVRLAGVRSAAARRESLVRRVRAVGSVVADERRQVRAQSKYSGWIERLDVNTTGQFVRRGDPAMAVYSPELLAAQGEYLLARDAAKRLTGSALPEVRRGGQELVVAARRRLELLDVPPALFDELERTRTPQRTVELAVPATGFVTEKGVVQGQEIRPGMELFTVTDLSRVWVEADFYESEARFVAPGQEARLQLPYEPGAGRTARITFLYPTLNPEARTLRARFELDNPGFKLLPGMFVDVELAVDLGESILVPDSAVLDTGVRRLVFVEGEPGQFAPREVQLGERSGGEAQILSGLAEGERVAVQATFLLDSESRLRAAVSGSAPAAPAADPHAGH